MISFAILAVLSQFGWTQEPTSLDPTIENFLEQYLTPDEVHRHDLTSESGVQQSNRQTRFVFRARYHGYEVNRRTTPQYRLFEASVETSFRANPNEGSTPVPQVRIRVKPLQMTLNRTNDPHRPSFQIEMFGAGFERDEQMMGRQGWTLDGIRVAAVFDSFLRIGEDHSIVPEVGARTRPIMSRLKRLDYLVGWSALGAFFGEINAFTDEAQKIRILKILGMNLDLNGTHPLEHSEWSFLYDLDAAINVGIASVDGLAAPYDSGGSVLDLSGSLDLSFARRMHRRSREWLAFYVRTDARFEAILNTYESDELTDDEIPHYVQRAFRLQGEAGLRFQF